MNWKRIFEIARWEYLQKVRSKSFILALLLTPLIMVASLALPALLADDDPETTSLIGVVDQTGSLFAPLQRSLSKSDTLENGQPMYELANYLPRGPFHGELASLKEGIAKADSASLAGVTEGTVVIRDSAGQTLVTFRSPNPGNIRITETFENAIENQIREQRLAESGIDTSVYRRLSERIDIHTVKVTESGGDSSVGFGELFFTSYILSFLLFLLVMTTGGSLVRSLVEEKSNRIMEILVSSAAPKELMWGKLLGLSGLGITQLLIWVVLAALGAGYFAASAGLAAKLGAVYSILPLLLVYLLLGYVFYSAIFIGIGSLVSTEQEAQVMTSYLVLLLMTPTIIAIGVITNPDAAYVSVLSYIPLFTPSLMMLRIVTKMPPVTEIAATLALMVVSTTLVIWACSKLFRTTILLHGKRPTMREIVRWLRSA